MPVKELGPEKLSARMAPEKVPADDSRGLKFSHDSYDRFQPRALQAFKMALAISGTKHNVYLSGEPNLGRSYFVKEYFTVRAAKQQTPPDWLYLHNFDDADRPIAVSLPAGEGKVFKNSLGDAVSAIRDKLPSWFERDNHVKAHERISRSFQDERDELFSRMDEMATSKGFSLEVDDGGGLTLLPLIEGRILNDEEFERVDPALRKQLRNTADDLLAEITVVLRKINKTEEGFRSDERKLHQDSAREFLKKHLGPLLSDFAGQDKIISYLESLEEELLDNIDLFMGKQNPAPNPLLPLSAQESSPLDDLFARFDVNLLVDNSSVKGAPVVVEDHPTSFNLLGSIERESELGALYTDFTLIKAGSLHRANHGYLILYADDVLTNPASWEGLLRALRTGRARIEDPGESEHTRTKTIEPEPVPLDLTVILIGSEETYELLLYNDERFGKYFKLKAHMQVSVDRTAANVRRFLDVIGIIASGCGMLPFDRQALAGLVDYSGRVMEDQKKLSLRFPIIKECMVEASALAGLAGKKIVDAQTLREALDMRDFRANLYEDEFMTEYDREVIKVETSGEGIGRANGLSVTMFGDYEFGLPHQISCSVGVGHGGILDLEREANMGGPIHTKGMMIIKNYLLRLFAQNKPLVMTGSLCFEQSYAGIEGDSASGAELAALISAVADIPISFRFAFTGAVSQSGAVMAVGGVNRKIEGFYEVCRRRGLTEGQGVLIPADNTVNLMLRPEVVSAVDRGDFHIYPVKTIEEALTLLTGMKVGRKSAKTGKYPTGTLYRRVDDRLAEFARIAREAENGPDRRYRSRKTS
ncbi:ATP-binding protein [Maridesulfovibrio bastinii]|uniref:ATP-binding protein n=1 Tax=Maridesulfovibrio bastinii TaxID=47157 RepID=UPI00041B4C0A|nr:ATP-binding protein [Maridesulfovibrio bastinii]